MKLRALRWIDRGIVNGYAIGARSVWVDSTVICIDRGLLYVMIEQLIAVDCSVVSMTVKTSFTKQIETALLMRSMYSTVQHKLLVVNNSLCTTNQKDSVDFPP